MRPRPQEEGAIYTLSWSPDSDQVLLSTGTHLGIRPLQPSSKPLKWKAHEAPVLKADWNPVNNLIVSGGEDCRRSTPVITAYATAKRSCSRRVSPISPSMALGSVMRVRVTHPQRGAVA